jgi:hypothetical protein
VISEFIKSCYFALWNLNFVAVGKKVRMLSQTYVKCPDVDMDRVQYPLLRISNWRSAVDGLHEVRVSTNFVSLTSYKAVLSLTKAGFVYSLLE